MSDTSERIADDLLIGADAIRIELGLDNNDQVYHLKKTGRLPIGKIGKILIASRRKLRRAADNLTEVQTTLGGKTP